MIPTHDIPRRYAVIGLVVILVLAAWMRFDGLGRFGFWTDEMYHVIAAQSMLASGEPVIPARGIYWRALITTGLTVASFSIFGESEWSARLPSALISLVFIGVAYRVISSRFTQLLALITVLFLAATPQFLQIGRECRMYAPFALFYFLGVFAVYRALESPPGAPRRRPIGVAMGLAIAALMLGLAMSLQYLAVNIGFTLALYCLLMCGYLARRDGPIKAAGSRYAVLLGLMLLSIAAAGLLLPDLVARFIRMASISHSWYTRGESAPFCLWFFQYYYPALWFLYPIGAVILVRRYGRLGLFIVCAFVPVLLAHMYLFTERIAERYLVYILPFFFMASACVIEAMLCWLAGWVRGLRASGARLTAVAAVLAAAPAMWLFLHPWLGISSELRRYGLGPDWKQLATELRDACDSGIVVANWPREVMYYGGRFPDYFATRTYEHFVADDHVVTIAGQDIPIRYILDSDVFEQVLQEGRDVYLVTTDWAFNNDAFMNDAMRRVVLRHMTELTSVGAGQDRIVIYHTRGGN